MLLRLLLISGFLLCSLNAMASDEPYIYDDGGKRDPFMPLITTTGVFINVDQEYVLSDLTLEGIVTGNQGNIAIVNGQVLNEKQTIGDFIIESINPDHVVLLKGTQRSILRLKKED